MFIPLSSNPTGTIWGNKQFREMRCKEPSTGWEKILYILWTPNETEQDHDFAQGWLHASHTAHAILTANPRGESCLPVR